MLESSPSLRASGFALTIWNNAFRALDVLGVGDKIRKQHLQLQKYISNSHVHRARVAACSQFKFPAELNLCRPYVFRLRVMPSATGEIAQEVDLTQQGKQR